MFWRKKDKEVTWNDIEDIQASIRRLRDDFDNLTSKFLNLRGFVWKKVHSAVPEDITQPPEKKEKPETQSINTPQGLFI